MKYQMVSVLYWVLWVLAVFVAWIYRDMYVPQLLMIAHVFIDPLVYFFEWIDTALRYALRP